MSTYESLTTLPTKAQPDYRYSNLVLEPDGNVRLEAKPEHDRHYSLTRRIPAALLALGILQQ